MLRVTKDKGKQKAKRGPTRFRGIVTDAATLGVSRVHLYLVLSGKRRSRSLLIHYRELQRHRP